MNDMSYTKRPIGMSIAFYVWSFLCLINLDLNYFQNVIQVIALICFATFLLFKPCAVGLPISMGVFALFSIISFWRAIEVILDVNDKLSKLSPNSKICPGSNIKVGTVTTLYDIFEFLYIAMMVAMVLAFLAVLFKTLPNSTVTKATLQKLAGTAAGLIIVSTLISLLICWFLSDITESLARVVTIEAVLQDIACCVAFWYLSADIICLPRISFAPSQPQYSQYTGQQYYQPYNAQYAEPQYQQPQYQQPQYQQPQYQQSQQQPVNNQAGSVHKWRCECGNMISSTPCPFCGKGGAKTVDPQNENVVMVELESFKKLLDAGLITEEDYNRKKKELLGI